MKTMIIGAGGHGRVVCEILSYHKNIEVVAFVDKEKRSPDERIMGIPVIGGHTSIPDLIAKGVSGAIVAVGDNAIRASYFEKLKSMKLELVKAIHRTAHIAGKVKIGEGSVVGIGAIIATDTDIGNNVIINTGAIVEHGDLIGDHVHIAPGTVLSGAVKVGDRTFIGAGSVIKHNVNIGSNVAIGAGSVVLEDLPDNVVAVGAPARIVKTREVSENGKKESLDNRYNWTGWSLPGQIPAR